MSGLLADLKRLSASTEVVPLVVDVDGTLLRSDLLIESALRYLRQRPWAIVDLLRWLVHGKQHLKSGLAEAVDLPVDTLPYDPAVLARIRTARAEGRPVYLASASHRRYVEAIAAHLGPFAGVFATDRTRNLAGARKAEALVEAFGEHGFDYIGNDAVDRDVWARCRHALVVAEGGHLLKVTPPGVDGVTVLENLTPPSRGWLRMLRPHQWSKNLLLFLPLLAAHAFSTESVLTILAGIVAFSLTASTAYVINDLVDLVEDRAHPTKRHRPFASGAVPLQQGILAIPVLLTAAFLTAATVGAAFTGLLALYFAATLAYSFVLKHQPLVDVMTLALLYTLRAVAGAVAIQVEVSPWLLAFCLGLFLCLAIVKRVTEVARTLRGTKTGKVRGYHAEDLQMLASFGAASGFSSVLVFALYINTPTVMDLYGSPALLWAVCLLLLFWVSRILLLANRAEVNDDPIVWALSERGSVLTITLAVGTVLAAVYT
ncbi:MAG: UbiA family prenyltransferase [Pseudomonadota bacterium]